MPKTPPTAPLQIAKGSWQARRDGLILLGLGCVVFLLFGSALESMAPVTTQDFRVVYYSARCLLDHRDPYNERDLAYVYHVEGGESPHDTPAIRQTERQYIYFPTAFVLTVPFACLPFGPAHILWLICTAVSLVLASFLIWRIGAEYSPVLCGGLVGLCLADCVFFLAIGNPGGITVGLCVIAVWCLLRNRFVPGGIIALSISVLLKPHVAGPIWVYFLFAGPRNRTRALQVLTLSAFLAAVPVVWLSLIAPHWMNELHSILQAYSTRGGINDPGPASHGGHGIGMMISLQVPLSFIWDNPTFYNWLTYLICAALFLVWMNRAVRARFSAGTAWFAIAPIAVLSLLPVYHRLGDAKLLLLTVPAAASLWAERRILGWCALAVSSAEFLLTGEPQWAVVFGVLKNLPSSLSRYSEAVLWMCQVFPVPAVLLMGCVFYLWVYINRASTDSCDPAQ